MGNNPNHYTKGTHVRLNADAIEQGLGPRKMIGIVISPYPLGQFVFVKWPHKRSPDSFHVDLLNVVRKRLRGKAAEKMKAAAQKRRSNVAVRQAGRH